MDDDIQYLGTKLANTEPQADPCESPPITGITLHVDKCGDGPPTLTFYRANSGYVNIGRKSGSDNRSMRRENDDHNAVFACQVVSARHAKLVLSDSGQIYIIDLVSRHGTHIVRRGEASSRMLQPGVETPLADGDVLTFGKVVGAGAYHVSPVTVRVELLTSQPSSEPLVDPVLTPFSPAPSRPRRLSLGRYGLISAACIESDSAQSSSSISVSSDVAFSPSDQESDVEDEHACMPTILQDNQGKSGVKIPAFRSFIRDIYRPHSPVLLDEPDDEPLLDDAPGTPLLTDAAKPPSAVVVIDSFTKSRSHSPMEVATPSPSPLSEVPQPEPAVIGAWPASRPESPRRSLPDAETGRSEAAPTADLTRVPQLVPALPSTCPSRSTPISNDALIELMHRLPPPPPFFQMGGPFSTSIASDFGLPSAPQPPPPPPPPFPLHRVPPFQPLHKVVSECVNSEIKGCVKNVEERMSILQNMINELKSHQSVIEEDAFDLQHRVDTLEPDSERLLCRVAIAERNITSVSALPGQMMALQSQVTSLREKLDMMEPRHVEPPMDDLRACADALNNLVSEMKSLREDVEKRIEDKMETIQSARAEALGVMKEVVVAVESARSQKRKREDEEAAEEMPDVVPDVAAEPVVCSPPPSLNEAPVFEVSVPQVPVPQLPICLLRPETYSPEVATPQLPVCLLNPETHSPDTEFTRPKKRARTAIYTVARTAAAMAIGAAATWSALAFS